MSKFKTDCGVYEPVLNASGTSTTSETNYHLIYEDYLELDETTEDHRGGVGLALLAVVLSTIIAVAVIGNLLVVVAVASNRRLRSVTNCFVGSLAFSDLLVGALVMPPSLAMLLAKEWPLGQFACELWLALDVLLCTASILNLCCISLDRYLAVTRPLAYWTRRSRKMAAVMLTVVWLAAAVITGPPVLGWQKNSRARRKPGECHSTTETVYVVYSACGSFFIPLVIMLYVYGRILRVIYQRDKIIRRHKPSKRGGHRYSNARSEFESTPINSTSSAMPRSSPRIAASTRPTPSTSTATTDSSRTKHVFLQVNPSHANRSYDPLPSPPLNRRRANMELSHAERLNMWLEFHDAMSTSGSPCQSHGFKGRNGCPSCWSAKLTLNPYGGTGVNYYFTRQPSMARWNVFRRGLSIQQQEGAMSFVKEKKAALALAFVVGGFIACWMPFFVAYILKPFCASCQLSPNTELGLTWLGWVNSAINPFIYAFSSLDFRMAFWRLTFGLCIRSKRDMEVPFAPTRYSNFVRERSRHGSRRSSSAIPRSYQCSPRRLSSLKRSSFSAIASV